MFIYLIGFFVTIYPLFVASQNAPKGSFNSRRSELVILRSDVSLKDKMYALRQSTKKTLAMFNLRGSQSVRSRIRSWWLQPFTGIKFEN